MSSLGSTYWLKARVSALIRSRRWVFTSVPMPKEKIRVPAAAFFTRATIGSSRVSPTVGRPSVRNTTR